MFLPGFLFEKKFIEKRDGETEQLSLRLASFFRMKNLQAKRGGIAGLILSKLDIVVKKMADNYRKKLAGKKYKKPDKSGKNVLAF